MSETPNKRKTISFQEMILIGIAKVILNLPPTQKVWDVRQLSPIHIIFCTTQFFVLPIFSYYLGCYVYITFIW